jgi:threonine dehydrogenase-like Zn-dependent dehydrogenase
MKALQILAPGNAELVDVADPIPGPGEVVVEVEAVASCPQWDLTMFLGKDIFDRSGYPKYPTIPGQPGHEMAGIVESLGDGVDTFSPGDPVVSWRTMGELKFGYYAAKACLPVEDLLLRPIHVSAENGASLEMAMCVASCFLTLPNLRGENVSIGGLGPAGLIAVQMAKAAGAARVIGFDINPKRCEFALTLGADDAKDPRVETIPKDWRVQYAIDCSGHRESVQFQMDIAEKGIALFGVPHEPYTFEKRHWGLTIYGYKGHTLEAALYAMRLLESGDLRLAPLNTITLPLSKFAEGTMLLKQQEALKVLYYP